MTGGRRNQVKSHLFLPSVTAKTGQLHRGAQLDILDDFVDLFVSNELFLNGKFFCQVVQDEAGAGCRPAAAAAASSRLSSIPLPCFTELVAAPQFFLGILPAGPAGY